MQATSATSMDDVSTAPANGTGVSTDVGTPVLVVDLDGTLIHSDMLYETFWAALHERWTRVFKVAFALAGGRAAVKRNLADMVTVDPATLPYNDAVLEKLRSWRAAGGPTALVSASDNQIVQGIAQHLGLFDHAQGSEDGINLKGAHKAEYLKRTYPEGFQYAGDSRADLAVWPEAVGAITVDLPSRMRADVTVREGGTIEHLQTRPSSMAGPLLKALRPHQWMKNLLLFLPILSAHHFELHTLGIGFLAFIVFSLTASSVYLTNDLLDLAADRAHPRKCKRPFAAGTLSLALGTALAPGLLLLAFGLALAMVSPSFLMVMVLYYLLTTLYSFSLKRRMIIDIFTLAILYTLRIVAGAAATGLELSVWILAFSMFFFLALAAVKRQAELVSTLDEGHKMARGRGYTAADLPFVSMMALGSGYVSVLVLALYLTSDAVMRLYSEPAALWGICVILLYWISRTCLLTHRGEMHDDPLIYAVKDHVSQFCAVLILGLGVSGALL